MTEATPLVVIVSCSLIVMMPTHHQQQTPQLHAAPLNVLAINLVPFPNVMPVSHTSITNVASVKIALSNGPIVPCITLPLDLKWQKILMP